MRNEVMIGIIISLYHIIFQIDINFYLNSDNNIGNVLYLFKKISYNTNLRSYIQALV